MDAGPSNIDTSAAGVLANWCAYLGVCNDSQGSSIADITRVSKVRGPGVGGAQSKGCQDLQGRSHACMVWGMVKVRGLAQAHQAHQPL
jgi:hypothetical protein